jgi:4-aminobutyrate aminotransferase/(S)-3-amino-2-methylpropionate transaminase
MDAPAPGALGGTFGGNPVACAAALAVFELIERDGLAARASEVGAIITARLGEIAARDARIAEIRGRGAMVGAELTMPGKMRPDAALCAAVAAAARAEGVIVLTCGTRSNVLAFLPPLTIPDTLLDEALDTIAEAFAEIRD